MKQEAYNLFLSMTNRTYCTHDICESVEVISHNSHAAEYLDMPSDSKGDWLLSMFVGCVVLPG